MFKTSEAARAIGMPQRTMLSWLDRRVVSLGDGDVDAGTSGIPRMMCMERVIQVAISYELNRLGLNPTRASEAAAHFTDRSQPGRAAGKLFANNRTYLVVTARETFVINAPHAAPSDFGPSVVVDVGQIVERIDRALGAGRRRAA
jgi:hypothetical protein